MYYILALLMLIPVAGFSQTIELSPSQLQYNEEAVQLLKEERYSEAVSKLEASLLLGESNIVFLNLGRAHQRMGNCSEAKKNFARVLSVPQVTAPTPDEIAQVLTRFQGELPEVCPSQVTLKCPSDVVSVMVGDLELSCSEPTQISSGTHVAVVTNGFGEKTFDFDVQPEESLTLAVHGADPPPPAKPTNTLKVAGLVMGSAGTVALVTGLFLDSFWLYDREKTIPAAELEVAQSRQTINKVVLGSGVGLLALGLTSYIIGSLSESEVAVIPQFGSDYTGVGFSGSW